MCLPWLWGQLYILSCTPDCVLGSYASVSKVQVMIVSSWSLWLTAHFGQTLLAATPESLSSASYPRRDLDIRFTHMSACGCSSQHQASDSSPAFAGAQGSDSSPAFAGAQGWPAHCSVHGKVSSASWVWSWVYAQLHVAKLRLCLGASCVSEDRCTAAPRLLHDLA